MNNREWDGHEYGIYAEFFFYKIHKDMWCLRCDEKTHKTERWNRFQNFFVTYFRYISKWRLKKHTQTFQANKLRYCFVYYLYVSDAIWCVFFLHFWSWMKWIYAFLSEMVLLLWFFFLFQIEKVVWTHSHDIPYGRLSWIGWIQTAQ